ncbi:hypothetical protein Bca4012_055108 [Brassica carinata]
MEINSEANQPEESSTGFTKYINRQGDWLEKTRGNLMVAATVIAGMSFQVMVNPPGGVWQSDICSSVSPGKSVCKDKAGTSVLGDNSSKRVLYLGMVISSMISFSASMSLILLFFSGFLLSCLQEPRDNGNSGNVHGSGSALYICSILLCSSFGSTRRSNHRLYASNLFWILGSAFNFNTLNPTHSVLALAYLFDMLLSSTSTTISSTVAAIDSNSDPLKKRRKVSHVYYVTARRSRCR